ncbi:unnamed protein product [Allacma fusca]|uniref:Kazal-like domain-containing protein n=1 Tax=Allacma fusca TaxID=39272 RepID=A0A8J2JCL4_9HEXA|nr:unnamed protein product [Allacma fusca]
MKVALVFTLVFVVSFVVAAPKKENCWDCSCTKSYDPVCGSNDETYANKCTLTCAQGCNPKIKLVHKGQCGSLKDSEDTTLAAESVTEKVSAEPADDDATKSASAEDEAAAKIVEEIMMIEVETTVRSTAGDEEEQTTTKN